MNFYFWMLGRADEVLKVAGHRIGTAELEDAAISYVDVAEAAVASKAHPVKGESIVIFVKLKEKVSPSPELRKEMVNHMRKTLGPIASPDEVCFVKKLPKTRSGKIMRRILKAVANGDNIGDITTLEDATSVKEVIKSYQEMKESEAAK